MPQCRGGDQKYDDARNVNNVGRFCNPPSSASSERGARTLPRSSSSWRRNPLDCDEEDPQNARASINMMSEVRNSEHPGKTLSRRGQPTATQGRAKALQKRLMLLPEAKLGVLLVIRGWVPGSGPWEKGKRCPVGSGGADSEVQRVAGPYCSSNALGHSEAAATKRVATRCSVTL